MKLVYKAYPLLLWCLCLAFWGIGYCSTFFLFHAKWTMFLWLLPSAALGWIVAGLIVSIFPKMQFVNEAEILGHGYVHQPLDVIINFLLATFIWAGVTFFR
jgi:hypothetical protein